MIGFGAVESWLILDTTLIEGWFLGIFRSPVDRAIVDCLLLDHEIRFSPRNWQLPEVLLCSTLSPAKSASQYPIKL